MSDVPTAPTTAPDNAPPVPASESFYPAEPKPEDKPPEKPQAELALDEGEDPKEPESEVSKPPEGGEEDEGESISSLSELIEHYELDPDWAQSLKVSVKVDGQPAEATLADLVKSYQIGEAAERRLEEAKSKAKAQTQELADKAQALESQYAVAAELVKGAERLLDQDTKSIDWARLREEDPAEYSAKRSEVAERRASIEQMKKNAVESYQNSAGERQQQFQAQLVERRQTEESALLEKHPEWKDADKAKDEKSKLAQYLMNEGFSKPEVANALDHRLILMARKAMLYDQAQSKTSAAKKKVAKVPKVMKPGAKADSSKPKPRDAVSILYG